MNNELVGGSITVSATIIFDVVLSIDMLVYLQSCEILPFLATNSSSNNISLEVQ